MAKHCCTTILTVLVLAALAPRVPLDANGIDGWPGLWGGHRSGAAHPNAAPAVPKAFKQLWRRPAAGGYSEIVVAGSRAFTMELRDGSDFVVAMEAQSGREVWRARVAETYRGHDGSHDGPIATPAVDGNDVFAVGPHGHVLALDAATGKERWRHHLAEDFGAASPVYGFSSSPLVEGALVVIQTGGEKSRGLVALDRRSGKAIWSAANGARAAYSSPVSGTLAGVRQIVAAAGDQVVGVSPADGRVLWTIKGPGSEEVNNSPQVLPDDRVLLTFWNEAVMVKIARSGEAFTATELWRSPRIRNSQGPTIYRDGYLYGFAGAMLVCLDATTGEVKWRERTYEGAVVGVGANLLMLSRASGDLHVIRATPSGYQEVMRTRVFTPGATSITGPSVAGGRVYLRNVEEMTAFRIEG